MIVEKTFIIVALLCIPIMLLVKPFVLLSRARRGLHVLMDHGDGSHKVSILFFKLYYKTF